MDFFEHQEQARKQTGRLVMLFILAVIAIVVLVYLAVVIALWIYFGWQSGRAGEPAPTLEWWQPQVAFWSTLITLAVVAIGTLTKIGQLRQGGGAVAEMMGGRQIEPDTEDPDEKKVLNVVEEMAIASGTAVPPVYLMPRERGINAFAAGFTPDDAVIAVTRGTIHQLDRDELQGVIAHEFSHILNSDMRTNIRLMGVIHGIVVLSIIGLAMVRMMFYGAAFGAGHHSHSRAGGDDEGGGGGRAMLAIAALGIALLIIGSVGALFGKLIKAAVSRQREYLADAAAVQFTRYPDGLAGALKKIGGLSHGSRMRSARAEEASHMFFGQAFTSHLTALFATHPPLTERIRKLDPSFDGEFPQLEPTPGEYGQARAGVSAAASGAATGTDRGVGEGFGERLQSAKEASGETGGSEQGTGIGRIGNPSPEHLQYAARLIRELPEPIKKAAHEPYGARAVVYALLLDPSDEVRQAQWQQLEREADPQVHKLTQQLAEQIDRLEPHVRLPLLDMTVPALRELSPTQYDTFKRNLDALIHADQKIDLFEWMLRRTLNRYVAPERQKSDPQRVRYHKLDDIAGPVSVLLSTLAYIGHSDKASATHAFEQAKQDAQAAKLALAEPDACGHEPLDEALQSLSALSPKAKRTLLNACAACIAADKQATVREVELLRLISDSLGCPMPPLLPGQPLR